MKTKLIIAVATLAIVFGLYGLAGNLQAAPANNSVPVIKQENKIKIWFVTHDIQSGERVKRSDLQIKIIPESEANQLGISEDIDLKFVKGAVYSRSITAEQVIYLEDIIAPQDADFIELVLKKNRIPFAITIANSDIIGGLINYGSYVDIVALTSTGNEYPGQSSPGESGKIKSISVSPVLMGIKVLQVQNTGLDVSKLSYKIDKINLILELTQKQVAKLTIAKRIAELQVHKSIGNTQASELSADAGDILTGYRAVKEFRANNIIIK